MSQEYISCTTRGCTRQKEKHTLSRFHPLLSLLDVVHLSVTLPVKRHLVVELSHVLEDGLGRPVLLVHSQTLLKARLRCLPLAIQKVPQGRRKACPPLCRGLWGERSEEVGAVATLASAPHVAIHVLDAEGLNVVGVEIDGGCIVHHLDAVDPAAKSLHLWRQQVEVRVGHEDEDPVVLGRTLQPLGPLDMAAEVDCIDL
mmetsp:Transcript_6917/g.16308  ORF Transcript_6917/g.16308 Transcript_6917/m.16308 type:complete len:200 (+) Transcript_6917:80-679(+)